MSTRTLLACILSMSAFASASANDEFHGEALNEAPTAAASTRTRSEVKVEFEQARASGQIPQGDAAYKKPASTSTKTRKQVKEEFVRAREAGELVHGDAGFKQPPGASNKTRAQAKEELLRAKSQGKLLRSDG